MIFLMALQDINLGQSKFSEDEIDEIDSEAPDLIPNCVAAILTQSRPERKRRQRRTCRAALMPHRRNKAATIHAPAGRAGNTSCAVAETERGMRARDFLHSEKPGASACDATSPGADTQ